MNQKCNGRCETKITKFNNNNNDIRSKTMPLNTTLIDDNSGQIYSKFSTNFSTNNENSAVLFTLQKIHREIKVI